MRSSDLILTALLAAGCSGKAAAPAVSPRPDAAAAAPAPAPSPGFAHPFTGVEQITAADGSSPFQPRPLRVGRDRFRIDDLDGGFSFVVEVPRARLALVDRHAGRVLDRPVPEAFRPLVALAERGTPCPPASDTCRAVGHEQHEGVPVSVWTGGRADGFARLWLDDALGFPLRIVDHDGITTEIRVLDRAAPGDEAFDPTALLAAPPESPAGLCDPRERTLRRALVAEAGTASVRLVPADAHGQPVASDDPPLELIWRRDISGDDRTDLLVRDPRSCSPGGACPTELHVDCGDGTFERVWSGLAGDVTVAARLGELSVTVRERDGQCDELLTTAWRFAGREYHRVDARPSTTRRCR